MDQTKSVLVSRSQQDRNHKSKTETASEWSLRRGRCWIALATLHLTLVCLGAAQFPFYDLPSMGLPLGFYTDLSGASNGYGFFSPGIYSQIRSQLDVYEADGTKRTFSFDEQNNREAELRFNDVIEQFINTFEDPIQFQRSLAASLAGSVFAQDTNAQKVDVRVQRFTPPSRADWLKGQRAQWEDIYSAAFLYPKDRKISGPKDRNGSEERRQEVGSLEL